MTSCGDPAARRPDEVRSMPTTSWTWRYESADGASLESAGPATSFPTQADAETWIGEEWRRLLEAGVDSVSLFEDGDLVYGPMSLHPAQ
jgi:hypothetical protein